MKKVRKRKGVRICITAGIVIAGICGLLTGVQALGMVPGIGSESVVVDPGNIVGQMKAVNGINNGPKSGYQEVNGEDTWELDASEIYEELDIPMVRVHDAEYPYGQDKFVDIHCIFPDFSRDPEDADAYNFQYTDKYIAEIVESGAQVFFRLGDSIDHSGKDLYINPPEDYEKWARICEHIIRHYNQGWADGFYYGIQYWEIWNEPDNAKMWTETLEEYFELYRVTARYLKQQFQDIKIGGCGAGECSEENAEAFLKYLTSDGEKTPLDFFSWHTYTQEPDLYTEYGNGLRSILDENGYQDTEVILGEWNYVENWDEIEESGRLIQSAQGAAFTAASLICIQNSASDSAMYYDGQFVSGEAVWCGLYGENAEKRPGYYAFQFFDRLYDLGEQVKTEETADSLYCCAAADGKGNYGILLANYNAGEETPVYISLKLQGAGKHVKITRVGENHPNGDTEEHWWLWNRGNLRIEPGELLYIEGNTQQ